MNPYQKAIKALEDCVKDAMENNIDPGLQSEIWRHYQGMKAIDRQLPDNPKFSFKLDALTTLWIILIFHLVLMQQTPSLNTGGEDAISFGDYKSRASL